MTNKDIQLLSEAYNDVKFTPEQQQFQKNFNIMPNELPKDGSITILAPTGHGGVHTVTFKNGEVVSVAPLAKGMAINLPDVNNYLYKRDGFSLGRAVAAGMYEPNAGPGGEDEMMLGNYESGITHGDMERMGARQSDLTFKKPIQ